MSFEQLLKKDLLAGGINSTRYLRNFKGRANLSKIKIDTYANGRYLKVGEFYAGGYRDALSLRYAVATPMTFDMLISIYNVNNRDILVYRMFEFDANARTTLAKFLDSQKKLKPNFEVRLIGLQNNQEYQQLYQVADFLEAKKLPLLEADLFGNELRHVAIDMKLGMSFNVLLENRLYRAGELMGNATMEQFERDLKAQP